MNPSPKAVVTGVLLFSSILLISADEGKGLVYKLQIATSLNIPPSAAKTESVIKGDVIFEPIASDVNSKDEKNFKTSYKVVFDNLDIQIGNIDLSQCATFKPVEKQLKEPFVANFVNGLFQNIQVSKPESDLSANLKLQLSTIVGVDAALLLAGNDTEFSSHSKQDTLFGNCDVTYNVKKESDKDGSIFHVHKNYDRDACDGFDLDSAIKLDDSCSSETEQQSRWVNDERMEVVYGLKLKTVTGFRENFNVDYKPWKDSKEILQSENSIQLNMGSVVNSSLVTDFTPENSKILEEPQLTELNNDLIEEGKQTEGIKRVYQALACNPFSQIVYLSAYEQAAVCNKTISPL